VMADIPGLIEGAHEGVGLGGEFLRHIERTRVIVHLIDVHPLDSAPRPAEAYTIIRNELQKYSQDLADKPELVVANKIDLSDTLEAVEQLRSALDCEVLAVSGVTGVGLEPLGKRLWEMIADAKASEESSRNTKLEDDPFSATIQESLDDPLDSSEGMYDDLAS